MVHGLRFDLLCFRGSVDASMRIFGDASSKSVPLELKVDLPEGCHLTPELILAVNIETPRRQTVWCINKIEIRIPSIDLILNSVC